LSIIFRVISGSEVKLHVQCSSEGMEEMGYEFCTMIGSDMAGDTMLGKDVEDEQLCKLWGHHGILSQDEK